MNLRLAGTQYLVEAHLVIECLDNVDLAYRWHTKFVDSISAKY